MLQSAIFGAAGLQTSTKDLAISSQVLQDEEMADAEPAEANGEGQDAQDEQMQEGQTQRHSEVKT